MTYRKKALFIEEENLEAYAENISRSIKPDGSVSGKLEARKLAGRLNNIRGIHDRIHEKNENEEKLSEANEWLLDNWYLAQREGGGAILDIKTAGDLRSVDGVSLLEELCGALVRSGCGAVTRKRCEIFLTGFQKNRVLDRKELTLFIPFTKSALISHLSELCLTLDSHETDSDMGPEMGRVFTSLRMLSSLDLTVTLDKIDRTEQILRCDPAGIYALMDEKTRDHYRRTVSKLARRHKVQEYRVAQKALRLSEDGRGDERHVGYYLFSAPLGQKLRQRRGGSYISANILTTLFLTLLAGFLTESAIAALLLLLPVSDLVKNLLDFILLRVVPPRHVPRMELADGVPPEGRTICVISALLSDANEGKKLARLLEEYRLANRDAGENLVFGILADLPESKTAELVGADNWISATADAINELNGRYGGGFYLLCRDRTLNKADGKYMGWERKRGALIELARLVSGRESVLRCTAGSCLGLHGIRYILTLDTDTRLCPGSARKLVGAMLHPLNRPVVDASRFVVTSGTAIIQPRMAVELSSVGKSDFARIFAGQGGTDPYGCDSGELYMDMFSCGGFAGKGIIDAQVYLACMEWRIPANRVLSHDALEGAYLRGYYMGDVELTDSFPANVLSYYKRMHRWTRGDWQNAPWLGKRGRDLCEISRWRIFDNLRRSLVSPLTFVTIFLGFLLPTGSLSWAAAAALLSAVSRLLLTMAESAMRREEGRIRYHSSILGGAVGGLLQTVLRLLFLPFEAWICICAIITSLWRMLISHRGLLEWQTASQGDMSHGKTAWGYILGMWFAILLGTLSVIFSASIIGKAAGVVWILSPFIAMGFSLEKKAGAAPNRSDRDYLMQCAREIWEFFETFSGPKDHFLPPDNWQDQPPIGLAHRTSPTNIGLSLLSALSAADLGIAPGQKAFGIIENILATIERLPKWNGNLFNWYDTMSLRSLCPRYVSTVDSGNLAGCLIILRRGLLEYGQDKLASRAQSLLEKMEFAPLYDRSRRLFYIGWDADKDAPTKGWYDLLASEARLAGYIAVARGDVERRHWARLSRAQVQKDSYRGMASWTGTMFEYLMPELFLPCYRDSLLFESAKFCTYVQKRRTASLHLPWGVSESAFYSLDPALNYRYKAHGCAALALKRNMDDELVVSPYSSFLALAVEPRSSVRNLRRLDELGVRGRYGFWEAVDFTPSRCLNGKHEIVRCVMAHHLGMSLVSIANYLCDGKMPRRFMSEPAMSAYAGLLQEKVPTGGVLLKRRDFEAPDKPGRMPADVWRKCGSGVNYLSPDCCLLSNGAYHLLLTESGISRAQAGKIALYRPPASQTEDGNGFSVYLRRGGELISLLPLPDMRKDMEYSWEFSFEYGSISSRGQGISGNVETRVSSRDAGELRRITVSTAQKNPGTCEIVCTFEPVLALYNDYVNHPAFYKLGLCSYLREGSLIIRRLKREGLGECFLCLACDAGMELSCDRNTLPGRGGLEAALNEKNEGGLGWLYDPLICARIPVVFREDSPVTISLSISLASTEDEAFESAHRMLKMSEPETASFPMAYHSLLGMDRADYGGAMDMIKHLVFPPIFRPDAAERAGKCREGKPSLWQYGISGDYPIVCARVHSSAEYTRAESLIKRHALLSSCGVSFDLVFLTDDGGDYHRPVRTAFLEFLRKLDREAFVGARAGIHLLDSCEDDSCLLCASTLTIDLEASIQNKACELKLPSLAQPSVSLPVQKSPSFGWLDDGSFAFTIDRSLPPRSWSNMLTNGRFGYIASDCGTGHMWYMNAREMKITPWLNDPLATRGAETLELVLDNGERHSLFASPSDTDCRMVFDFGSAVWEKRIGDLIIRTTAFVPDDVDARVMIIETNSSNVTSLIAWCARLLLSGEAKDSQQVVTSYKDGILSAVNRMGPMPESIFMLASNLPVTDFTCDRFSWIKGEIDGSAGAGFEPCFGAVFPAAGDLVIVCGCDSEDKLRALTEPIAARAALKRTRELWRSRVCRIWIDTPDEPLNHLINGWAPYQSLACRIMGRTSIYQSGGAIGFRDQLQDIINLSLLMPHAARSHILQCCAHQFEEGDVQHWWHPYCGISKGVRTKCSDDLLWLPWALCEYVERTRDLSICSENAPYLLAPALAETESCRYEESGQSPLLGSVSEHAERALELVLRRGTGAHGLLLMGNGDWNDGMDKVGAGGKGESVWLTWFFASTAARFAVLLGKLGNRNAQSRFELAAAALGRTANEAWDGSWYLRGYYDDGTPLGSDKSDCCKIDSISQSFAAFCSEAQKGRVGTALDSALSRLFDRERSIVRLFTPSFEGSAKDPGYIQSYGPGFRENGGQYTHGAVWLAMACLAEGRVQDGYDIIRALLPETHPVSTYGAEPFVIAADVYSNAQNSGKAGWSWYTGSAGWFFRVVTEELLGLRMRDGKLFIEPRIPEQWTGFSVTTGCQDGREYHIEAHHGAVFVNGEKYDGQGVDLGLGLEAKREIY